MMPPARTRASDREIRRLRQEHAAMYRALKAVEPLIRRKAEVGYCMHDEYTGRSATDLYALVLAATAPAAPGESS